MMTMHGHLIVEDIKSQTDTAFDDIITMLNENTVKPE